MCFPTDNVSLLSWGCCFPSSRSVRALTVKTAHVSPQWRWMILCRVDTEGCRGEEGKGGQDGGWMQKKNTKQRWWRRGSNGKDKDRKRERKGRLMGEGRREWENKVARHKKDGGGWGTYWGVSYVDWAFTMMGFLCGRVGLGPKPKNGNFYFDSLPIHRAPKQTNCQHFSFKDDISVLHLIFILRQWYQGTCGHLMNSHEIRNVWKQITQKWVFFNKVKHNF